MGHVNGRQTTEEGEVRLVQVHNEDQCTRPPPNFLLAILSAARIRETEADAASPSWTSRSGHCDRASS